MCQLCQVRQEVGSRRSHLSIPYCLTQLCLSGSSLRTSAKSPHLFHCVHLGFSWPHFVLQGHWLGGRTLQGDTHSASENPLTTLKPISNKVGQRTRMGKWLPGICQVLSPPLSASLQFHKRWSQPSYCRSVIPFWITEEERSQIQSGSSKE